MSTRTQESATDMIEWRRVGRFKDKLEIQWELWALESETRTIFDVRGWAMQPVGTLVIDGDSRNVWVREEYRRQGIATGMFDVVEMTTGKKLLPTAHLTPMGKLFWDNRTNSVDR